MCLRRSRWKAPRNKAAGDCGRFHVGSGYVVLHDRFEAHVDRIFSGGAMLLNPPLPEQAAFSSGMAQIADFDSVVRTAEKSRRDA
jgi:hypothetical protein